MVSNTTVEYISEEINMKTVNDKRQLTQRRKMKKHDQLNENTYNKEEAMKLLNSENIQSYHYAKSVLDGNKAYNGCSKVKNKGCVYSINIQ